MMSWFNSDSKHESARVERGLFIPNLAETRSENNTNSMLKLGKPTAAVVAVALVGFLAYSQAAGFVQSRLAQPASTIVVTDSATYNPKALTEGPLIEFSDKTYFDVIKNRLIQSEPKLLTVDTVAMTATLYQDGQETLVAPIKDIATPDSWRHPASGYYTVEAVKDQRYSSLEQAYYTNVLELNRRLAIHGPATHNDGAAIAAPSLGVTLSVADAESLQTLVSTATPVLIHSQPKQSNADPLIPQGPGLSADSYLVQDLSSGAILAEYKSEQILPIASLTKLMTALVVAEEYDLEGEILIDQEKYVTTLISRLPGTYRTSVYDLLQLLLLESSNEAAEVLATHMGREEFITHMNTRAKAIGLDDTTFVDPSGLGDGNQATAADLYKLTSYIQTNYPFLLRLSSEEGAVKAARRSDFSDLENFNDIDNLDTFIGGKIGETEAAGQTSVTVHEILFGDHTRPVVIVLLGSQARDADVTKLHEYVLRQYTE